MWSFKNLIACAKTSTALISRPSSSEIVLSKWIGFVFWIKQSAVLNFWLFMALPQSLLGKMFLLWNYNDNSGCLVLDYIKRQADRLRKVVSIDIYHLLTAFCREVLTHVYAPAENEIRFKKKMMYIVCSRENTAQRYNEGTFILILCISTDTPILISSPCFSATDKSMNIINEEINECLPKIQHTQGRGISIFCCTRPWWKCSVCM